ncbi:MAG: NUDIX domain-containing protein [Candidatus Eisenbacteria bacterium]|nr:NUDIX domain-containing protein [Candidatus Eisenbacteria bacterium]
MAEARATKRVRVVAAVVWDGPRLLMTQRPPGGPLGLQWEFPGGKLEPGELPEAALVRELREELGVSASAHETLGVHSHDYPHGVQVDVVFIRCTLESTSFTPSGAVNASRWVEPREVSLAEVLEGDREFLMGLGARAQ